MVPIRHQYSIYQLLQHKNRATSREGLIIDSAIIDIATQKQPVSVDKNTIIRFRKDASLKDVKFVQDMDIPICQIVHAFNLSDGVTWPVLKTFCEKTVGVPALDVRMMRRKRPAEARIIFRSADEAQEFLQKVPLNVSVKGRIPKFDIETQAPKASVNVYNVPACTVVDECEASNPVATAVEVAHISQSDDNCFAKVDQETYKDNVVPTAVALDGGKMAPKPPRTASNGAKSGKGKRTGHVKAGANKPQSGTLVGMTISQLRRNSGVELDVEMSRDMFNLTANLDIAA